MTAPETEVIVHKDGAEILRTKVVPGDSAARQAAEFWFPSKVFHAGTPSLRSNGRFSVADIVGKELFSPTPPPVCSAAFRPGVKLRGGGYFFHSR